RHTRCLSDWSSDVCSSDLQRRTARSSARALWDSLVNLAASHPAKKQTPKTFESTRFPPYKSVIELSCAWQTESSPFIRCALTSNSERVVGQSEAIVGHADKSA